MPARYCSFFFLHQKRKNKDKKNTQITNRRWFFFFASQDSFELWLFLHLARTEDEYICDCLRLFQFPTATFCVTHGHFCSHSLTHKHWIFNHCAGAQRFIGKQNKRNNKQRHSTNLKACAIVDFEFVHYYYYILGETMCRCRWAHVFPLIFTCRDLLFCYSMALRRQLVFATTYLKWIFHFDAFVPRDTNILWLLLNSIQLEARGLLCCVSSIHIYRDNNVLHTLYHHYNDRKTIHTSLDTNICVICSHTSPPTLLWRASLVSFLFALSFYYLHPIVLLLFEGV